MNGAARLASISMVASTSASLLEGAAHGIQSNAVMPVGYSRMVTDQERTGAVPPGRQAFYDAIRPELITPLVVYLASRDCTLNHRAIAACAGRYSRIFAGYGGGWLSEGAEDVAAQVALLDSTDDFFVPESSVNETIAVCRQRAIDLSQM